MKFTMNWHDRFSIQLEWTRELRNLIYTHLKIQNSSKILESGCGTGALLTELGSRFKCELYGIDIDEKRLDIAKKEMDGKDIKAQLTKNTILNTKYKESTFDFIFTHYFFLWIEDLEGAFNELHRILKQEGKLIILAEPDYGGLIEEPDFNLKQAIQSNLIKQGSNPNVGREIPKYLKNKFVIHEQFTSSIPWLALNRKTELLQEIRFFEKILIDENYNTKIVREHIEKYNYFLYIPVFTYILNKDTNTSKDPEF